LSFSGKNIKIQSLLNLGFCRAHIEVRLPGHLQFSQTAPRKRRKPVAFVATMQTTACIEGRFISCCASHTARGFAGCNQNAVAKNITSRGSGNSPYPLWSLTLVHCTFVQAGLQATTMRNCAPVCGRINYGKV